MADPRWNPGKAPKLLLQRQPGPGVSGEIDFQITQVETNKRRDSEDTATTVAAPAAAAQQPQGAGVTPVLKAPPPVIIDRLHKEAISNYGGYIYVAHDHDAIETDQMPPTNPAYRGPGTLVSSIGDAYALSLKRMSLLKTGARIAIIPIGGVWYEQPLTIAVPGIDVIGSGRPSLNMGIMCGGQADTLFEEVGMAVTGAQIALQITPIPANPNAGLVRIRNCDLYADNTALLAQSQFYAENSLFKQTSNLYGLDENHATVDVQFIPPQNGQFLMRNCTLRSWQTLPDITTSPAIGRASLDSHPGGYAIRAVCGVPGPWGCNDINGALSFEWPTNQLILDECAVYGSAFVDQWIVEHIGGHVHGALPSGSRSGTVYAALRGRPLFDSTNGFYANIPGHVIFGNTGIYAEQIALGLKYNGAYPVGVNPNTYPGLVYAQVSECNHYGRWDGGAGSVFQATNAIGVADVSNTPTFAASYTSGGWGVSAVGSCPVAVAANRRFYSM